MQKKFCKPLLIAILVFPLAACGPNTRTPLPQQEFPHIIKTGCFSLENRFFHFSGEACLSRKRIGTMCGPIFMMNETIFTPILRLSRRLKLIRIFA